MSPPLSLALPPLSTPICISISAWATPQASHHACLFCDHLLGIVDLVGRATDDEGLLVGVVGGPAVKLAVCTGLLVDGSDGLPAWVRERRAWMIWCRDKGVSETLLKEFEKGDK